MLFVCISDKNYFPYACSFMASVLRTNPNYSIYYHLINGTQEQIDKVNQMSSMTLGTESIHFNSTEELKRHIINVRFRILLERLNQGHQEVCYSDVDMIVRKSLDPIRTLCKGTDLGIWMRHDLSWPKKESIFNAALIWVANTPATVQYLQQVHQRSFELMEKYEWFTDQIALYEIYTENPDALSITTLPRSINDDKLRRNSYIWAGKWSCDKVAPAFAIEEAYHLALSNGEKPWGGRLGVSCKLMFLKLSYPFSSAFLARLFNAIRRRVA